MRMMKSRMYVWGEATVLSVLGSVRLRNAEGGAEPEGN